MENTTSPRLTPLKKQNNLIENTIFQSSNTDGNNLILTERLPVLAEALILTGACICHQHDTLPI